MLKNYELAHALGNDRMHLILLPTEQCNFRCVYCYEDFALGRMRPGVIDGVERLLTARAPGLTDLVIGWFGGEPLLATDIIERIQSHVLELAAEHPRMSVSANMTTNGYGLKPDVFARMLELRVNDFQISFDGPRELHDQKRLRADGGPSFDVIWENLKAMRDVRESFSVSIRVHVSRENKDAIPEFLAQCKDTFGDDPRFLVFIRDLTRMGGPNDDDLPILDPSERLDTLHHLRDVADSFGLHQSRAGTGVSMCYAARANSFVVRADGRLNKCSVALEHPNNQIGRIFPDGRLEIEKPKILPWMRGLRSEIEAELVCPLAGLPDSA